MWSLPFEQIKERSIIWIHKLKYPLLAFFYIVLTTNIIYLMKNHHQVWMQLVCDWTTKEFISKPVEPVVWNDTALITLWFDDNLKSQYNNAFPLMEYYKFKGVLSIISSTLCEPGYMTVGQVYELQRHGWEIASHAKYHICDAELLQQSPQLLNAEVRTSKEDLYQNKIKTNIFASPCGYSTYLFPKIQNAVETNYAIQRIGDSHSNFLPVQDWHQIATYYIDSTAPLAYVKSLITQANKDKRWIIFTFHRIGDSAQNDLSISEDKFLQILQFIKDTKIPVVLPSQVKLIH